MKLVGLGFIFFFLNSKHDVPGHTIRNSITQLLKPLKSTNFIIINSFHLGKKLWEKSHN